MVGSILTSLIYCVLIKSSFGVYKTFQKESSAPWSKLTVVDFGIAQGGKISVDYSITSPSNLTNPIYFLINIINEDMRLGWYDGASVTAMCEAPAISRHVVRGSGTIDYVASTMVDRYSLVAIQCWNKDMSFATTVDIDTSMTNLSPPARGSNFDKNPSHLPIEEVFLARMYLGFTILYAVLLAGIVGQLAVAKKLYVKPIHGVFLATVMFYLSACFADFLGLTYYNDHGYIGDQGAITISIFRHLSSCGILFSIVLVSIGWTICRQISEKERHFFMWMFLVYFVNGFGVAVCTATESDSGSCDISKILSYVIQTLLILGAIIGMNFNVTQLRAGIMHSPWTNSMPVQYARYRLFVKYRLMFLFYLIVPTVLIVLGSTILTWREEWINDLMSEGLIFIMMCHVGITFGPLDEVSLKRPFGVDEEEHID